MSLGPRLAGGRVADVFAWGEGLVLKLYRHDVALASCEREVLNARAARAAGVRTPAVVDVVEVDDRHGIVFERVGGPHMLDLLVTSPASAPRFARELADLQTDLHQRHASGLRAMRERLAVRIELASALRHDDRRAAHAALDALPDARALCHGDFHPGNVIVSGDGGLVVIDWSDATSGDPHGDLARTSLLMLYGALDASVPPSVAAAIRDAREAFHAAWLARHEERAPGATARMHAWALPIAAARLAEKLPSHEQTAILGLIARLAEEAPHDVPCAE